MNHKIYQSEYLNNFVIHMIIIFIESIVWAIYNHKMVIIKW